MFATHRRFRIPVLPVLVLCLLAVTGCPPPVSPPENDNGVTDPIRADADQDGVTNANDDCPATLTGSQVDANGCSDVQRDADVDGVGDGSDLCGGTAPGAQVDLNGCAANQRDADEDSVKDDQDDCPDTTAGASVDDRGCVTTSDDSDNDGVNNAQDRCNGTPRNATVDVNGCVASQLDDDGDGTPNNRDDCPGTTTGASVNADGCAESQLDADSDEVADNIDQCPNTPEDAEVDAAGCPVAGDADGDGVPNSLDQCALTGPGRIVDANGCPTTSGGGGGGGGGGNGNDNTAPGPNEACGRGSGSCFAAHATPGCDNAVCCALVCGVDSFCCEAGENWDGTCATKAIQLCEGAPVVSNNACSAATTVTDGTTPFSNIGATTDGPVDAGACSSVSVNADVWFCYTATCTGTAILSLCGSAYDTTMAVYSDCGCPTNAPVGCSDDDCGFGLASRVTLDVVIGEVLTIRVGGFNDRGTILRGTGDLTILCTNDAANSRSCGPGNGACDMAHGNPGCDDVDCCTRVCGLDPFCCDVEWDDSCIRESGGLCGGTFDSCGAASAVDCLIGGDEDGCSNASCCNSICQSDPYCCIVRWDAACASAAATNPACQ